MTTQEALDILNKKKKISQPLSKKLKIWRDVYYGISLHTSGACPKFNNLSGGGVIIPPGYFGEEYQRLFDYFLFSRHPRESVELRNWRYSQYRPLTKAPFLQCIEVVAGTIFMDSNYSIEIPDEKDEDYIWGNNFSGYDLIGYFANVGLKEIVEDPNGLIFRIPKYPYYQQNSDRVEVDIVYCYTKEIEYISEKEVLFTKGNIAWYVNDKIIFKYTYDESTRKWVVLPEDANGYYAHLMGKLPATVAGGEWNTQGYFDSLLDKAKPVADDFIGVYSGAQLVDKEASHPFMVASHAQCEECKGIGQIQSSCEISDKYPTGFRLDDCSVCGGTGKISHNPGEWILVQEDQVKDGGVKIVNPDTSINSHHRKTVSDIYEMLLKSLHLYNTDKSESGAAKAIDQERMYKFISKVSNHMFDKVIYDTVQDIISYRNATGTLGNIKPATYPFKIVKPTQFNIKTGEELLKDFDTIVKSNMPMVIRQKAAVEYVDKAYGGDPVIKKKMTVVNRMDKCAMLSSDELLSQRAANFITQQDVIFSQELPSKLDALIEQKGDDWFINATYDEIVTSLSMPVPNTLTTNVQYE